jgi:hypothetical protein
MPNAERRSSVRYPFDAAVEIIEGNNHVHPGRVADISLRGCYITCAAPLAKGSVVMVKIRTETEYFQAQGIVAHSGLGRVGVTLQNVDPPFMVVLHKWLLIAMQRQAAASAQP